MPIPGSNLFRSAARLIRTTTVAYEEYDTRTLNAAKQWVATYKPAFDLACSVQAVDRTNYVEYGLDFQKNYVHLYAAQDVIDIDRDSSGDRFTWNGRRWQLESRNNWFAQDGWASAIAVEVGRVTS